MSYFPFIMHIESIILFSMTLLVNSMSIRKDSFALIIAQADHKI